MADFRIVEALRVYTRTTTEEPTKNFAINCKYCGGKWSTGIVGTINGKPLYNGKCSVCGLTTKDFDALEDLKHYLNQ